MELACVTLQAAPQPWDLGFGQVENWSWWEEISFSTNKGRNENMVWKCPLNQKSD